MFIWNYQIVFNMNVLFWFPTSNVWEIKFNFLSTFGIIVLLICIYPTRNDAEYYHSYIIFGEVSIPTFCPLFIWFLSYYGQVVRYPVYSRYKSLITFQFCQYFPQSVVCLFIVFFEKQKLSNLMKSNLSVFI